MLMISSKAIVGVLFHTDALHHAVDAALAGGAINAPSGPGLAVDLLESPAYRQALRGSNITGLGAHGAAMEAAHGAKIPRHSGLKFCGLYWNGPSSRSGARFG